MVEIETATISSKGQIVIPLSMREGIKEGDKFILIKDDNSILLKKSSELNKNFKEELEFARRTEEAWKRHDNGKFNRMEINDFLKEIKKW